MRNSASFEDYVAPPARDRVTRHERRLIDAHLKSKGARKLESGATGNTSNILDWLCAHGHDARRGHATLSKPYLIDGKKYNINGLFEFTNRVRRRFKLEPLTNGPVKIHRGRKKILGGLAS